MELKYYINSSVLEFLKGDITKQKTEAVVNAANNRLAPGGGVTGAIHRAAGPELWQECKTLGGCNTGEAKITNGYDLPANFVIHTVGPIYHGDSSDAELLESCYRNSLNLTIDKGIKTISFPAISTGAFGYPKDKAAEISLKTVINFLKNNEGISLVRFVLYTPRDLLFYEEKFKEITENLNIEISI